MRGTSRAEIGSYTPSGYTGYTGYTGGCCCSTTSGWTMRFTSRAEIGSYTPSGYTVCREDKRDGRLGREEWWAREVEGVVVERVHTPPARGATTGPPHQLTI